MLLWNNTANSDCSVALLGPGGVVVSANGRGVSALADWRANKTIALPRAVGRALAVAGVSGSGLTTRAVAQTVGEEEHTLTTAELAFHAHTLNDPGHVHVEVTDVTGSTSNGLFPQAGGNGAVINGGNTGRSTTGMTMDSAGGGRSHNNMQPTVFFRVMVKL